VVNTGTLIGAIGTVLGAMATVLVGYFVKRTDRVAKLTQSNMADQEYILRLVSTVRDDYWSLADWAYFARGRYAEALQRLRHYGEQAWEALPAIPDPKHRELETKHAKGLPIDDDD
jgi:CRISPR/Cas system-associated endonuclease Cas1